MSKIGFRRGTMAEEAEPQKPKANKASATGETLPEEDAAEKTASAPAARTSSGRTSSAQRAPSATPANSDELLKRFLSASGFKASEVDGQNDRTRTFVTTNGGKYQLLRNGNVRRVQGPRFPKETVGE
jgi:hypothetical protein